MLTLLKQFLACSLDFASSLDLGVFVYYEAGTQGPAREYVGSFVESKGTSEVRNVYLCPR